MKDLRYIIKRILIGVGVGVSLMLIRGNLLFYVNAEELITRQPLSIGIFAENSYNQYQIISNTGWDGHDVWSPGTPSNDWGGTARIDYNYTGGNYCTQTQNYGTLSGIFYNASTSLNPGAVVKFLYTDTSSEFTCSTDITNNKGTFSCTGIDFTKNFALLIYNANPGTYGLVKQLGYTCEASIGSQIQNDNQNTQNIINNNNQNTQNIINNNNQNTQNIINNQNQNKQDIINNQNQNTDKQIESQKVCDVIDKDDISINNWFLGSLGDLASSDGWGVTNYIPITNKSDITMDDVFGSNACFCLYDENKHLISCQPNRSTDNSFFDSLPSNVAFARFSIYKLNNRPTFRICRNGNQAIVDSQNQINGTLNDDNVSSDTGKSFFNNFQANGHGLSGVITAPLRLINSLSSSSCSPLSIPLPFVNQNVSLPCMSTIYSTHFPTFLSLYQLITTGIIGYWVLVKLFGHVKGMQSPNDDRIEVFDL